MVKANHNRTTLQQPAFTVIKSTDAFELRDYDACDAIQIELEGTRSDATRKGFNALYRYISGNNLTGETYAMTAPVLQEPILLSKVARGLAQQVPHPGSAWTMTFHLPSGTAAEMASQPSDPRIARIAIPPRRLATLAFSGRWSDRNFQKRGIRLMNHLEKSQLKPLGPVIYAFYDAPYVLPHLRKNEVQVAIMESSAVMA